MSKDVTIPAGFWIRVLPSIIDSIILGVAVHAVTGFRYLSAGNMNSMADSFKLFVANTILGGIYAGILYKMKGATLGKKAFALEVVDNKTGERISFSRGFLRDSIGKILSMLTFGIGYLVAAFNKDKRTLHDYIFDTRVVKRAALAQFQPAAAESSQHELS